MFDRAKIMKAAWEIVKKGPEWKKYRLTRLKYALQDAWSAAKHAAKTAIQTPAEKIYEALIMLECKERWNTADFAEAAKLRGTLQQIEVQQ